MAHMLAVALSTEIPGIDAVDLGLSCYNEVNHLFLEQFNQLVITVVASGCQQRPPAVFAAACHDSANFHNQCCGRSPSRASTMARQPSPAGEKVLAPRVEPTGAGSAATTSPSVETAAVDTEVKINISDYNPEARAVTDILDNTGCHQAVSRQP